LGELGPIYGKQWRKWKRYRKVEDIEHKETLHIIDYIDQIANLINELKTNPDSRRLMVNAWNVGEIDQMVLPPCHFSFQCYSHEKDGKRYLSLAWNQRSIDFGLGLPFNIASYGLLLEIIAKEVGMIPYELIGNLGDCHIYNNHIDGLKEQLTREPYPLPKIYLDYREGEYNKDLTDLTPDDFILFDYQSHSPIKLPLSN
jgi:thymidylate synthase